MKIMNVENDEQKEYPKEEQVEEKKIKKSIPNGWKVIGGTVIMVGLVLGGKMLYDNAQEQEKFDIAGFITQEVQIFNNQFSSYEGKINGSYVKNLLEIVVANNIQNQDDINRYVSVLYNNNNIMFTGKDYLKQFAQEISQLKNSIDASKEYQVTVKTSPETKIVYEVEIQEINE